MKNTLLAILSIISFSIFGQEKLIVEYESFIVTDVEAYIEEMEMKAPSSVSRQDFVKAVKDGLEKKSYFKLHLSNNESIYEQEERISNEQSTSNVRFMYIDNNGVLYKNLIDRTTIESKESFNKYFLVQDSLKEYNWTISREKKEILGHPVRKATVEINEDITVTAWYAPKITFSNGPENYHGLPGLILEIESDFVSGFPDGTKKIIRATSVKYDNSNKSIKQPTKGKVVTNEELDEFQTEQFEKMRQMHSGGVDKE